VTLQNNLRGAIWEEGSDTTKQFERSIMVCGTSGEPQYIKAYCGQDRVHKTCGHVCKGRVHET
jgi:hypothetical protein